MEHNIIRQLQADYGEDITTAEGAARWLKRAAVPRPLTRMGYIHAVLRAAGGVLVRNEHGTALCQFPTTPGVDPRLVAAGYCKVPPRRMAGLIQPWVAWWSATRMCPATPRGRGGRSGSSTASMWCARCATGAAASCSRTERAFGGGTARSATRRELPASSATVAGHHSTMSSSAGVFRSRRSLSWTSSCRTEVATTNQAPPKGGVGVKSL